MVLGGEKELDEEHGCECEDNAVEDDLDRQRAGERGPQLEDWIMREAGDILATWMNSLRSHTPRFCVYCVVWWELCPGAPGEQET